MSKVLDLVLGTEFTVCVKNATLFTNMPITLLNITPSANFFIIYEISVFQMQEQ